MSDYWGDILPNEAPRKRKSYDHERQLLESRRKNSAFSNLSEAGKPALTKIRKRHTTRRSKKKEPL